MGLAPGKDVAINVVDAATLGRYYSPSLTGFRTALEPLGRRSGRDAAGVAAGYAGPEGVRIVNEVWPLELEAGDSG